MKRPLLLFVLLLSVSIPGAAAHPFVAETSPVSGSNAAVGTAEIYIRYTEPVELGFSSIKVFDGNGNQIDNNDMEYFEDEKSLRISTPPLQEGIYTVSHKVLSKVDGHLVPYAFVFGVGDIRLDDMLEAPAGDAVFLPEAGARFPGLVGQTVILGAVIASLLIWGTQNKQLIRTELDGLGRAYHGRFMSVTGVGLVLVVASNIAMLAVQTLRLESSVLDTIQTTFGTTWLYRMILTAALLGVWFWMDRKSQITRFNQIPMLALSLVLIGTTTMIGHGAASEQPAAIVLDYIHNLVAAAWIGGLVFFAFVMLPAFSKLDAASREKMSLVMIPRFSIAFVIAVGVVIITGPVLMWQLESDVGIIAESTYGKLIMAKIGIAAAMIGLGAMFQLVLQRSAERALGSGRPLIYGRLRRMLRVDVGLGVLLLGIVALLANAVLPAGEVQRVEAHEALLGLDMTEFSGNARFDIAVRPFVTGENSIAIRVSDSAGMPLPDSDELNVKVSNPGRGIFPIEAPMARTIAEDGIEEFHGNLTFGFAGRWQVEVEAPRTENASESILLDLLVKPRLADIRFQVTEYGLPEPAAPLYALFDGRNSIWLSDASAPRLWKFDMESGAFESFSFDGMTSTWLTRDPQGKIWFADTQGGRIGFIDPGTAGITMVALPQLDPAATKNIPTSVQSDRQGNIWLTVINKDSILRYDPRTEKFTEIRLPDKESLPFSLGIDDAGTVWFTASGTGMIGHVTEENNVEMFAPDPPLRSPEALLFDGRGKIWVSEHGGAGIAGFDPILHTFERFQVPNAEALPYGMSLDRYENIWIAQHTVDSIAVFDPDNETMAEVPIPTATSFAQFTTRDSDGNVWFVEQRGNKLATIKMTELPHVPAEPAGQDTTIQYTELASPLIAMGIVAASLFFVKNVRDKRRLNGLILADGAGR